MAMAPISWSRLTFVGEYVLDSPLRIGAGADRVALDLDGRPMIPASTFRGALRVYVESVLRGMARHESKRTVTLRGTDGRPVPTTRTVSICCQSVDKREDDVNYQGCLTGAIVSRWQSDPVLRPSLETALFDCTCACCRLFGTPWLASRVLVADLRLIEPDAEAQNELFTYITRGGLSVSRERDTMIESSLYQRQAFTTTARFKFNLIVEDATPAEQGMIVLGLRAFEAGLISLGGDRARGLGHGRLVIDWANCRYVDLDNLIGSLLGAEPQVFSEADAEMCINALGMMLTAP